MAHGRPDYSPTAVDVVLRPEWAAKEGVDKSFQSSSSPRTFGQSFFVSYTVPLTKTLYIVHFGIRNVPVAAVDGDKNQICEGRIVDFTTSTTLWNQGGNGGLGIAFHKPIVIPGDHRVDMYAYTFAAHDTNLGLYAAAYEI